MSAPGAASAAAAAALATLKQQELLYFQQQAAALFPFSVAAQQEFVRHAQMAAQQQQQLQLQKQQQQLQQQQWAAAATAQQYASHAAAMKQQQQQQQQQQVTAPPTTTSTTTSATSAWPPSLKSFVTRALSECTGDSKRTELMEQSLKFLIHKHTNAGTLATNPWHLMPIPDIPRSYAAVAASSTTANFNSNAAAVPQPPTTSFRPPQPSIGGVPGRTYPPGRATRQMSANKLVLPPLPTNVATTSFQAPPPPPPPPELKALTRKQKRKLALETAGAGRISKKAAATLLEQAKRARRAERFDSGAASTAASSSWTTHSVAHDDDWDDFVVRGTSQALEKGYLRLTSAPDPATVRPLGVLVKAFAHVKQRWERENDYAWVCDQLKAIRQDLTVQHIDDEFAVQVYESHARWALESDDLNEFNQCQTQLNKLYSKGVAGARDEFTAYRLIYFVHLNLPGDLARQMLRLTREERENLAIKHALAVCTAVTLSNYQQFFHLHARAPNMSAYLLDYMVPGMRRTALAAICAAYRPTVPLSFVKEALGFAHAKNPDNELMRWLDDRGALYDLASGVLQTKETAALL